MNILKEICDRRLADIEKLGFSYGHQIPEERNRPVVPFLAKAGTILEVKRASPSKGNIAPDLNPAATAEDYIKAGTSAISVLTEENYFKGTLEDLMSVAETVHKNGDKVAVLRKDFLLEPEEIRIAYKCGADAVLLIARILDKEKLLEMAQTAFELGLSVLLELRDEEAVEKAFDVLTLAVKMKSTDKVVLGINARDLKTFTIDMLIPLRIKQMIEAKFQSVPKEARPDRIRVISESGVLNPQAAALTANLGFNGILIGEAVAKDPENADKYVKAFVDNAEKADRSQNNIRNFWEKIAAKLNGIDKSEYRPMVKICGITNKEDGICAAENGADILGFIMEEKFARHADIEKIPAIREAVLEACAKNGSTDLPLMVGVITMPESPEAQKAYELFDKGVLDAIQLHGCRGDIAAGYEAMRLGKEEQLAELDSKLTNGSVRILADSYVEGIDGGTGVCINPLLAEKIAAKTRLWLAGGINPANAAEIVQRFKPELIDVSSGLEISPGKKDHSKIKALFSEIRKVSITR